MNRFLFATARGQRGVGAALVACVGLVLGAARQASAAATPNVSMAIEAPEGPILPGEAHLYRVTVANAGTAPTDKLVVEVNVPEGTEVNLPEGGTCAPQNCAYSNWARFGSVISWNLSPIPPGGATTVQFRGVVQNSAQFPPPVAGSTLPVEGLVRNAGTKLAQASSSVETQAQPRTFDVAVTGPTEAASGELVTYDIHLSNLGTGAEAGLLSVSLPSGVQPIAATKGAKLSGQLVSWELDAVAGSSSEVRSVQVKVAAAATTATLLKVRASLTSDTQEADSTAEMLTRIGSAAVTAKLSVAPRPVQPGAVAVYKLDVTNRGTMAVEKFSVVADVPHGAKVNKPALAGVCAPQNCAFGNFATHGSRITWQIASLPAGASTQLQFPATVDATRAPLAALMTVEGRVNLPFGGRARDTGVVGTNANLVAAGPLVALTPKPRTAPPKPPASTQLVSTSVQTSADDDPELAPPEDDFVEDDTPKAASPAPATSGPNVTAAPAKEPSRPATRPKAPKQRVAALAWSRYCKAKWKHRQLDARCMLRWKKRTDYQLRKAWIEGSKPKK